MNIKPILIVRVPDDTEDSKGELRETIGSWASGWSVIVVREGRKDVSFEGIVAKKLTPIQFDELKKLLEK